jgi:hypothetical protein
MKTEFRYVTPYMLARSQVQVFIAFDDNGDLQPLSVATLLLAELRQNTHIRRTLNKEGHICFLFGPDEWQELYKILGMEQDKWAQTMRMIERDGYIDIERDEQGGRKIRFFLEVIALH